MKTPTVNFCRQGSDRQKGEGSSENATDIFFTIQSDRYGNFEVELLARDKTITLNIKSPAPLVETLKSTREQLKTIVEEQGYSLAGYGVGEYQEAQTILQRFPEALRGRTRCHHQQNTGTTKRPSYPGRSEK